MKIRYYYIFKALYQTCEVNKINMYYVDFILVMYFPCYMLQCKSSSNTSNWSIMA